MKMSQLGLDLFESDWRMPTEFPDIRGGTVSIDLETRDDGLKNNLGPGWAFRNQGYVIGVAVATDEKSWYFPIRHASGDNMDPERVLGWTRDLCANENVTKVFHNSLYDIGWLRREGVLVRGKIYDTMVAAPLLDENRFSYSLNNLGFDYIGERKSESLLEEIAKNWKLDPKQDMWQIPAKYVGEYAEQDTALTLKLWRVLEQRLKEQGLESIFELEMSVLPIVLESRWRGVRVDLDKAERTKRDFTHTYKQILAEIKDKINKEPDIWSADSLAACFKICGLDYPLTRKGKPSFEAAWLDAHEHWLPQKIATARKYQKAAGTFVQNMIMDHAVDGRIHCEMHSLRSDEGGTVSGRFSFTSPNLQQVPAREPLIAGKIRGLFLPEEGAYWDSKDYSQQEPRLTVHYAKKLNLEGADAAVEYYKNDPSADFHQIVAEMTGLPRKHAKIINLGLSYNMGALKLCRSLGLPTEFNNGQEIAGFEAKAIFDQYHARVPFVGKLNKYAMEIAEKRGYIKTLEGRYCRFDRWEPAYFKSGEERKFFYSREDCLKKYPDRRPKRAFIHKAMNRLIQGSAADQTKRAMVALHAEGACIMLQVHDELCLSTTSQKESLHFQKIMEEICPLEVPSKVDSEVGDTWGDANTPAKDLPWSSKGREMRNRM